MTTSYAKQLGSKTQKTHVEAQKIDGSFLKIYRIVLVAFKV